MYRRFRKTLGNNRLCGGRYHYAESGFHTRRRKQKRWLCSCYRKTLLRRCSLTNYPSKKTTNDKFIKFCRLKFGDFDLSFNGPSEFRKPLSYRRPKGSRRSRSYTPGGPIPLGYWAR